MSFSGINARWKVISGELIPATVIRFVQTNGMIMLEHDNGQKLNRNGYLFLRFGRYSISLRTVFAADHMEGVKGISFAVNVRRRRRRATSETIIAMVIDQGPSVKPAPKPVRLRAKSDGRNDN